jgi:site-specific recombinase XerD
VRVRDAGDAFLVAARDGRARDASGRRYSEDALEELDVALRGHIAEELGDLPLGALRRWQVQGFVNELADSGLSPHRLHAIVAALRAVVRYAHEDGLIEANPIEGLIVPSGEDREPRPFTTTDQLTAVTPAIGGQFIPDQMLWQLVKVVTIVFVLIALVLAAESI